MKEKIKKLEKFYQKERNKKYRNCGTQVKVAEVSSFSSSRKEIDESYWKSQSEVEKSLNSMPLFKSVRQEDDASQSSYMRILQENYEKCNIHSQTQAATTPRLTSTNLLQQ